MVAVFWIQVEFVLKWCLYSVVLRAAGLIVPALIAWLICNLYYLLMDNFKCSVAPSFMSSCLVYNKAKTIVKAFPVMLLSFVKCS